MAILKTKISGIKKATKLQAKEYQRRLDELNHAHEQAAADKNKFITADLFYASKDEMAKWRLDVDTWRSRAVGITTGIGIAAGLCGGLIVALVMKLIK